MKHAVTALGATLLFATAAQAASVNVTLDEDTDLQKFWEDSSTDPVLYPRSGDVQINGTISIAQVGGIAWFGLVDKKLHDEGPWTSRGNGAYIQVYRKGADTYEVGTSDGRGDGGEYWTNSDTFTGLSEVNYSLVFGDGTMNLTLFDGAGDQFANIDGVYGDVKIRSGAGTELTAYNYNYDEFEYGAYLAAELYRDPSDNSASYSATVVPVPSPTAALGGLALLGVNFLRRRSA